MTIYVIIAGSSTDKLRGKIAEVYPTEHYNFPGNSSWFVYDDTSTTKEVAEKLGISGGALGAQAVVMPINGWNGWAPGDLWEWLRPRWAKDHPSG
jgi:hypothetical protein